MKITEEKVMLNFKNKFCNNQRVGIVKLLKSLHPIVKVLWRLLACGIEGARVPVTIKHSTVREETELVTQAEIIEWEREGGCG
jgi:hypothetical protein